MNMIYKHCTVGMKHGLKTADIGFFPKRTGVFGIFGGTFGIDFVSVSP